MSAHPRTLVAMAMPIHRRAIAAAIGDRADVVTTSGSRDEVLDMLPHAAPELLIVEYGLPGGGCELCATVKADDAWESKVTVLVLGSASADDTELIESVHAGADGFVSEADGLDALRAAVDRLANGEASIPGSMLGSLLRTLIRDRRQEDQAVERFARLSLREREVLKLVADGLDNAGVAERMVVSKNTARTHVQNILRKLEVGSRLEAASLVNAHGLLERFPAQNKEGS